MTLRSLSGHVFFALLVLFLAIYAEYSGLDLWIEHLFYDTSLHQWPFRSMFFTKTLLHDDVQTIIKFVGVLALVAFAISWISERYCDYRTQVTYFLLASCTGPIIVAVLKNITHIQTPWELREFNGNMPYVRLFDSVDNMIPIGHAFPGGHSSVGFAFFSIYFLCYFYAPAYRYLGLLIPLALGILFGFDQEVRGAHFLSHDLISMFICWSSALFWAWFYLQKQASPTSNKYVTT